MDVIEDVLSSALALSLEERARLAERLLQSLDDISEEEAEGLWLDEAERRIRDYRAGRVETISAEQVLSEARERLR
ncbi:MAG: addiction module protein [bacterium]|nr:addiction module protein [bacterium]